MNYLLAIAAGAVQGLTEFLPVSSTGHLIIFENLFHISQQKFGLAFDASLHLGTLLAVLIFFKSEYLSVFNLKNQLAQKLAMGTVPAVILGLIFENQIETTFRQTWLVASALIIYSLVFIAAEKLGKQTKTEAQVTSKYALIIGFFQAVALIPGVSRSGSTISGGLFLGIKRENAAKFAFMLSGPIVGAAGIKKFLEVISNSSISGTDFSFFIIGMISSATFGYLTIKFFLKYLKTRTLYPFVVYRIILGVILLTYSFIF